MIECPFCSRWLDYIYTENKIRAKCFDCDIVIGLEITGQYHEKKSQILVKNAW